MMRRYVFALLFVTAGAGAQIRVSPAVVNVNASGASTVFLSYGNLRPDQFSVEALWCADVISAAPDIGQVCNPATTWGRLPLRNDLSRPSGRNGFTDVMTIPQNVIRRAYQRAAEGEGASFFYVRRFASRTGAPDEYIAIVCRMAGQGSDVPLALTDVRLRFSDERNVLSTPVGQAPPPLFADLTYTGSGRLTGRWELVLPGDDLPTDRDLLPEGSLPAEERSRQRRYLHLSRFNVHLPPTGKFRLEGPDVSRLPSAVEGLYHVLLRIEASDDGVGNTDLAEVGSGTGIVTTGGLAGFPLPVLRYYVGSARPDLTRAGGRKIDLIAPATEAVVAPGVAVRFAWSASPLAAFYRLDLRDGNGNNVLGAIIEAPVTEYVAPPLVGDRQVSGRLTWSLAALDARGAEVSRSEVAAFRHGVAEVAGKP